MSVAGLTPNGLVGRSRDEIEQLTLEALADAFPGIDLAHGPERVLVSIMADELATVWSTLADVLGAARGGGTGTSVDLFAAITGSTRRPATRSRVHRALVTLDANTTLRAGATAAVAGAPNAQFATIATVTNTSGAPGDVEVDLVAITAGPVAAPTGTLTVIVKPQAGWTAITNPTDAVVGKAKADDTELLATRLVELGSRGRRTATALRAAVAAVADVQTVAILTNETSVTDGAGRPPKSIEVLIWDDGAADGDAIAQAIYDCRPAGIATYGIATGTARDALGATHSVSFSRVGSLRVYVSATGVVLRDNADADWATQLAAACAARGTSYVVGQAAYTSQLLAAVLDAVPSIEAIAGLTLGTAPSPVGHSVVPTYAQIVRISSGDVTSST